MFTNFRVFAIYINVFTSSRNESNIWVGMCFQFFGCRLFYYCEYQLSVAKLTICIFILECNIYIVLCPDLCLYICCLDYDLNIEYK